MANLNKRHPKLSLVLVCQSFLEFYFFYFQWGAEQMGVPAVASGVVTGGDWGASTKEWGSEVPAAPTKDWADVPSKDWSDPAPKEWGAEDVQPSSDWGTAVADATSGGAEWA